MEIREREHLHQVDLLLPAPVRISEREYWKNRREQERFLVLLPFLRGDDTYKAGILKVMEAEFLPFVK